MVTLLPLTTKPSWLGFPVQYGVEPAPGSARHSQRLSPITLLAFIVTQLVVVPTNSPPTLLQMSYRHMGSAECSTELFVVPTSNNDGDAVVPASNIISDTFTP